MLRLDKIIKPWKESAALNDHINLYGLWNETAFLTKSGDVGMVLRFSGVDYESLDHAEQEYAVKRLEAALKAFGPGFHVYQYLFKSNRPHIPFANYDDPIVEAAIASNLSRVSCSQGRIKSAHGRQGGKDHSEGHSGIGRLTANIRMCPAILTSRG
jgi:hypothetical protein